ISAGLPPLYSASARFTAVNGRPSASVNAAISIHIASESSFLRKWSIASATGFGWETKRKLERCVQSGASGKRSRIASQSTRSRDRRIGRGERDREGREGKREAATRGWGSCRGA